MSIRYLVALAVGLLITISFSTEAHLVPYTGENPRSVTLVFKSGTATFNLSKGVAEDVVFRVGDKSYSTSFAGCTPLEHIRFESAIFDAGENPTEGTFTLLFEMGAEESRAFGLLPRIQISFARGNPSQRLISREVAKNTAFSSSLCPDETSAKKSL
jgi:hypothetical protein